MKQNIAIQAREDRLMSPKQIHYEIKLQTTQLILDYTLYFLEKSVVDTYNFFNHNELVVICDWAGSRRENGESPDKPYLQLDTVA